MSIDWTTQDHFLPPVHKPEHQVNSYIFNLKISLFSEECQGRVNVRVIVVTCHRV